MRNLFYILFFMLSLAVFSQQEKQNFYSLKQGIKLKPNDTVLINTLYKQMYSNRKLISADTLSAYSLFIYQVATKDANDLAKGYACTTLGNNCNSIGDYTKALIYLFEAEKIYTKLNLPALISKTYNIIGNTYLGLGNIVEQKKYFLKCYDISLKHNLPEQMALGAGGIASSLSTEKKYKESNEWNFIAEKIFKEQKFNIGYVIVLENIADNYRELNMLDKAMEYSEKAEPISLKTDFNYAIYGCYKGKGLIYEAQHKYKEAIGAYKIALDYILKDKANHNISEIYKLLSDVSFKDNQLEASIKFLNLHIQYKDSVFNENSHKLLIDVEKKYETEKKDIEIKILNKENELTKSELSKKKTLIYSGLTGVFLLLGMLFFIFRSNLNKNKVNKLLAKQKIIIEEKQKEILDSIHYAKRIQDALFENKELITENLPQHFIYFNPKDIVSGDFYWAHKKDHLFYIAVCDSTGHGVPGAFMSLLNIGFLNEAINEKLIKEPNKIFDYVRQRLVSSISKEGQRDGFDGILVCINSLTNEITYASANNAPFHVSNNTIVSHQKNKMPVGLGVYSNAFDLFSIPWQVGDMLYLYTDGYTDQFGGEEGKKFKFKKFNEFLVNMHSLPVEEQRVLLEEKFNSWKGDLDQVDDVLVLGIKL